MTDRLEMTVEREPQLSISFFKLPQEVRVQMYIYAFKSTVEVSKIISRNAWKERERNNRDRAIIAHKSSRGLGTWNWAGLGPVGSSGQPDDEEDFEYEMRSFPGSPLQPMIVSKQFFTEAASAWFHNSTLEFESHDQLDRFIQEYELSPVDAISSIRVTWECNKYTHGVFAPNIRWCTGLRRLHVTVVDGLQAIEDEDKEDFFDDLDARDFRNLQIIRDIPALASLKQLDIVPGKHRGAYTRKEREQYSRNLLALQSYIWAEIKSSADTSVDVPKLTGSDASYVNQMTLRELKKLAHSHACLGSPVLAASYISHAMNQRARTNSKTDNQSANASVDSLESDVVSHDTIMVDSASTTKNDDVSIFTPSSNCLLVSDIGRTRVKKPSKLRRPRLSKRDVAIGGVLFANTVCSTLALYFATRK